MAGSLQSSHNSRGEESLPGLRACGLSREESVCSSYLETIGLVFLYVTQRLDSCLQYCTAYQANHCPAFLWNTIDMSASVIWERQTTESNADYLR